MKELFTLGKLNVSDFIPVNNFYSILTQPHELKLMLEEETGAVRLERPSPMDEMYGKYWYRSGINQTMRDELKNVVESILKVHKLKENDIWLDIACNDGTMFEFMPKNIIKIGVDPCDDSYKDESEKKADCIVQDYFKYNSYSKSKFGKMKAKIISIIAMFYDLDKPDTFLQDVYKVLDDDGLLVMQMSYTPLMIKQLAFDNICHEHIYYYSLFNIKKILERNGFSVVDCTLNDINGGSFRVFIKKKGQECNFYTQPYRDVANFRVDSLLEYEKTLKLDKKETWEDFFRRINELKEQTVSFIKEAKANGKTVWGYGACHDSKTRLVTENGIKSFDEIDMSDKVYTLNTKTNNIELSSINEIMIYPYDGDMIHFYGKRIDMMVTPNHNVLFQTEQSSKYRYEIAEKIINRERFSIPKGKWVGTKNNNKIVISDFVNQDSYSNKCRKIQNEFDTSDFLYLLGLFIGDGYVSNQKGDLSIKYCIPIFDKARKRLIDTLNRMNLMFIEYDNEIQVDSQALRSIFSECGEEDRNKKIPKWALEYSPIYLRYLLDGLIDSDGWHGENNRERFSTTSFSLIKDMIELSIKLGYFPSFSTRPIPTIKSKIRGREIDSSISYTFNIGKHQPVCFNKGNNSHRINYIYPTSIEYYNGFVWCLSVNNKNFLVERNGKIAFSGNSTKGNTTLQYFGLDETLIDGIAERSTYKWGLKTSGTNIPIYSEEEMRHAKPDYLLILPWHFINEFKEREKDYLIGGGKFIVPCPKFEVVGYEKL